MGIHVSISDYRLIFEKIDFDKNETIDYFKFCLLDYDKEALREELIREYELKQLLQDQDGATKIKDDEITGKDVATIPKNKEGTQFMQ